MTLRRTLQSSPGRPDLDRLIEDARTLPEWSASAANPNFGNGTMFGVVECKAPSVVRNPDLAFVRSELQKVRGILDGIERRLDEREAA